MGEVNNGKNKNSIETINPLERKVIVKICS